MSDIRRSLNNVAEFLAIQNESSGFKSGFIAPDGLSADVMYTLPIADGTGGYVLSTNGAGILSWIVGGGGGGVSSIIAGTNISIDQATGNVTVNSAPPISNSLTTSFTNALAIPGITINGNYTFPTVDGTAGYVLSTNGSGVLSWVAGSGGSGAWFVSGSRLVSPTVSNIIHYTNVAISNTIESTCSYCAIMGGRGNQIFADNVGCGLFAGEYNIIANSSLYCCILGSLRSKIGATLTGSSALILGGTDNLIDAFKVHAGITASMILGDNSTVEKVETIALGWGCKAWTAGQLLKGGAITEPVSTNLVSEDKRGSCQRSELSHWKQTIDGTPKLVTSLIWDASGESITLPAGKTVKCSLDVLAVAVSNGNIATWSLDFTMQNNGSGAYFVGSARGNYDPANVISLPTSGATIVPNDIDESGGTWNIGLQWSGDNLLLLAMGEVDEIINWHFAMRMVELDIPSLAGGASSSS